MWEFCLYFENGQLDLIVKLRNKLKSIIKNHKGVVVLDRDNFRLHIALELSNEKALIEAYKIIYNDLINIIYSYYKNIELDAITENMFNNTLFYEIVKKMLYCFDEEYDKNIIKANLYLDNSLSLEGFYNFQLRELKLKWEKLANIILNNSDLLNSYRISLDLIRYLLNGLKTNCEKVCLHIDGNKYLLKNTNNEQLIYKRRNFSKKQSFTELCKNLIELSPKKIILCGEVKEDDFKLLRDIFLEKL